MYPFSAIVGQEMLKTALLLNAIDPRIGGVLIRGEKGTAKSTAVRALATVLPEIDVVQDCRFSCDPADPGSWCHECRDRRDSEPLPKKSTRPRVVDLPVSATEDRLVGTLDLEHALKSGERLFEPGLLAAANRSILYVDEVNLLDDHIVDTLLDAAAMGINTVEREGISFAHPARFILVGTMNPEEGDIRPQLLDRFGLCVEIEAVRDPEQRVDILKRRRAFDEDAVAFMRDWIDAEDELRIHLKHACLRLASVEVSDEVLLSVARLCAEIGVDGHRADLTLVRAAAALVALNGGKVVTEHEINTVAPLVFAHRVRRTPFNEETYDKEHVRSLVSSAFGDTKEESDPPPSPQQDGSGSGEESLVALLANAAAAPIDSVADVDLDRPLDRTRRSMSGRRHEAISNDTRGRYARSEPAREGASVDIALDATIRAAAPFQTVREGDMAINIQTQDVMTKVRKRKVGASAIFCVDASGSMKAADRMTAAKAAVIELLADAYQRRDRVGVVSFRGDDAQVVLAPTASVELAQLKMRTLPTGGSTPLAAGLLKSLELLDAEIKRNSDTIPWLILVTDGRANVGLNGGLGSEDARAVAARVRAADIHTVVIDTGSSARSGGAAREIARAAGAEYVRLTSFDGHSVAQAVRSRILSI